MRDLAPFLVVGLATGSIYGLTGVGLVLTYKTSGVFNFAHGAVAAAGAYTFYDLHVTHGLPWPLALLLVVGGVGPIVGVVIERFARYLADVRPVFTILATVGLMLGIQGLLTWIFGPLTRNVPQFLPDGDIRLSGVTVQYAQLVTMIVGILAVAGLYVFFARHRVGVAMRAVVDDPDLLGLSGTSAVRVRRWAWMIGTAFATLSGILLAPSIGLDAVLLTLLVVQAFGATAIGGFSSLPLTYVGGLAIGVAGSVATKAVATAPSLAGLPSSIPFIALFAALLIRPRRLFQPPAPRPGSGLAPAAWPRLRRLMGWATPGIAVALVAVPAVVGARLPTYTTALVYVLIFLSLALLVWTSGQISLSHAAFAAVGAASFSHLSHGLGVPWPVALVGAGLAVVPLGAALALPAIRLSGVYLALATFGFGLLMERVVYRLDVMFGSSGLRTVSRPAFGLFKTTGDKGYYYVVLAVVALAWVAVWVIIRSRLGRLLRALGDSPVALATYGLNVNRTRVLVFCISAFLAGIGGALFAGQLGVASARGFGVFESLLWLAVLVMAGSNLLRSSVLAAGFLVLVPAYAPDSFSNYQTLIFGVAGVAATVVLAGAGNRGRNSRPGTVLTTLRSPVRDRFEVRATNRVPPEAVA